MGTDANLRIANRYRWTGVVVAFLTIAVGLIGVKVVEHFYSFGSEGYLHAMNYLFWLRLIPLGISLYCIVVSICQRHRHLSRHGTKSE